MANDQFGYALDRTDELWQNAEGESREDAAAYAFREEPDAQVVYVCNQIMSAKAHAFIDADELLDLAEERASEDETLGHHEDNVFDHSAASLHQLEVLLTKAVVTWLAEYPGPLIWTTIGDQPWNGGYLTALRQVRSEMLAPSGAASLPATRPTQHWTDLLTNAVLDRAWHAMIKTLDGNNYVGVRRVLAEALPELPATRPTPQKPPADAKEWTCPECGGDALYCGHVRAASRAVLVAALRGEK